MLNLVLTMLYTVMDRHFHNCLLMFLPRANEELKEIPGIPLTAQLNISGNTEKLMYLQSWL